MLDQQPKSAPENLLQVSIRDLMTEQRLGSMQIVERVLANSELQFEALRRKRRHTTRRHCWNNWPRGRQISCRY
jgi:hypothetical protein